MKEKIPINWRLQVTYTTGDSPKTHHMMISSILPTDFFPNVFWGNIQIAYNEIYKNIEQKHGRAAVDSAIVSITPFELE